MISLIAGGIVVVVALLLRVWELRKEYLQRAAERRRGRQLARLHQKIQNDIAIAMMPIEGSA